MNREEYFKAIDQLNKWSYHYYCLDDPIATDEEYDKLYQEVLDYERDNKKRSLKSPTQRVGFNTDFKFRKLTRENKMYSLEDVFNLEDLEKWLDKLWKDYVYWDVDKEVGDAAIFRPYFCCSPKFDGCSLELEYNQFLFTASTRGDGITGEDVNRR